MKILFASQVALLCLIAVSCGSGTEKTEQAKDKKETGTPDDGRGSEYEAFMARIDASDSLTVANTLFYTKEDGSSYQIYVLLDDSSSIVRMEEKYTGNSSGTVLTNYYYFKDDKKYATKEVFISRLEANEMFVERVTYYKNEKPIISKSRTAKFEEYLESEPYQLVDPVDCPTQRAERALKREGEFATNFVSTVSEDPLVYIIVGEGKEDGYVSALLVQQFSPAVMKLINNESAMKGTPLDVQFQEVHESSGYTFQALLGLSILK